jgi:adenosylcobinamide kinase/adenosylcobinamide-phosphate guanylyltransferase
VLVTEEVGLAVHPATEAGRRFTDALGALNAAVADVADDVWLCVAGRVTRLERPDAALEGR